MHPRLMVMLERSCLTTRVLCRECVGTGSSAFVLMLFSQPNLSRP